MPNLNLTKLLNMIDPEVMAPMIQAELPKAIKFTYLAPVDTTLVNRAGSTITVPAWKYIGDAKNFAEGESIHYEKLETMKETYTVKKAGIGVEITDEALLSGLGDPIGEATRQIAMSIASKIDNDVLEAINTTTLSADVEKLNAEMIDEIEATFNQEDGQTGVIFFSPADFRTFRKNTTDLYSRASQLGDNVLVTGALGEVLGWQLAQSAKVEDGKPIAVKRDALKIFLKRGILPEKGREMDEKYTKVNADVHYVVALINEAGAVKVNVKDTSETGGARTEDVMSPDLMAEMVAQGVKVALAEKEESEKQEKAPEKEAKQKKY